MRKNARFVLVVCAAATIATAIGCAGGENLLFSDDGGADGFAPNPTTCPPCVIDSDCSNGAVCAQLGGDSFCTSTCPTGNECDSSHTCQSETTVAGDQATVCVPNGNACGLAPHPPTGDAGPPTNSCPGLADPSTSAACTSCKSSGKTCQANGCYGGWWCDTNALKCQAPPSNCGSSGDAGVSTLDGSVTSTIGSNGGTESTLYFGIIGDTRPAVINGTSSYPKTVITKIFADINALSPMPPFVVTTGDYMFASANGTESATQLGYYMTARAGYSGVDFPALGNHECTGATTSNCGTSGKDGFTTNYNNFLSTLLGPISKTLPYYVINVSSPSKSWTAKFVFVAANAWDSTQATWLDTTLSTSTTYTFIIRHESATASTAPGVSPSESIMKSHPYTMSIVGHAHTYSHPRTQEVLFGNGGAPLASGSYGYGLVTQRTDGAIQVDAVDYMSGSPDTSFRFALNPDGTVAP